MKIAMIGSGAAGSVFAGYLKKGGADDIWLVDLYKEHMEKVAADGLIFRNPDGEFHVTGFNTTTNASDVGIADIVIIMSKTTQTDSAMETAKPCIGENTVVATLQNGLGNEVAVMRHARADRVLFGCGNMGTELPAPGVCVAKPASGENLYFGAVERNEFTIAAGEYLEKCFAAGGAQPKFYEDVRPKVWRKCTSNSSFNTTCAMLRLKIKEVYADPNGMKLVWGIVKEADMVAEALGVPGMWDFMQVEVLNVVNNLGDYYPSMAQDTMAHRQTEVGSLTGAIADYGDSVGIETPTCDFITLAIKAIEANYDLQYKD